MQLSEHFTLEEFEASETAERLALDNTIQDGDIINNIVALVTTVLEPLRTLLDLPLIISSGYRSEDVNRAVGGAVTSQHLTGSAADVRAKISAMKIAQTAHNTPEIWEQVDQMIIYPGFVHFSHKNNGQAQRNQCLYSQYYTGEKAI